MSSEGSGNERVLTFILVISVVTILAGGVATAQSLSVDPSIEITGEPTLGETTGVSVIVPSPDLPVDGPGHLTAELSIDGKQVASRSVSLSSDGGRIGFEHEFSQTGEHRVRVDLTAEVEGVFQTYRTTASISRTVDIGGLSGVTFPVPESLRDEVNKTRRGIQDTVPYASVLATNRSAFLVLSKNRTQTGTSIVEGRIFDRKVSARNLSFGVIVATDIRTDQDPQNVTVSEVSSDPGRYALTAVRASGHHKRASVLYDPDQGAATTVPASAGVLTSDAGTTWRLSSAGQLAGGAINGSDDWASSNFKRALGGAKSWLYTFTPSSSLWRSTNATVDGVVLPSGSIAREFVTRFDRTGITGFGPNAPLLYVTGERTNATTVPNVSAAVGEESNMEGGVIEVTAQLDGTKLSTQEFLEHNTGCNKSVAQLDGCANVPLDIAVTVGVAQSPNSSGGELLPVVGLSSRHDDTPIRRLSGRYRMIGEFVRADQLGLNQTRPFRNRSVLVVTELERVGDGESPSSAVTDQAVNAVQRLRTDFLAGVDSGLPVSVLSRNVSGAAFPVPELLRDEVAKYRSELSGTLPTHAYVLATEKEAFVVLSNSRPIITRANVTGIELDAEIDWRARESNLSVLLATADRFETDGTPATVREVSARPDRYHRDLVEINANYRRVTTLIDPDAGDSLTATATTGLLTAERNLETLGADPAAVRDMLLAGTPEPNRSAALSALRGRVGNVSDSALPTMSFDTAFWASANATVDALVVDPTSTAYRFVERLDPAGIVPTEPGGPILYVVDAFEPTRVPDVADLRQRGSTLDGETVSIEARLTQTRVSVQEAIEHGTGCTIDRAQVPTPSGPVCVNLPVDELIHGGVVWDETTTSGERPIVATGVSSRHQDRPAAGESGRYRIVGTVASSSRIDDVAPRLKRVVPNATLLVVHDLDRIGDINRQAVANETRAAIENRADLVVPAPENMLDTPRLDPAALTELDRTVTPEVLRSFPPAIEDAVRVEQPFAPLTTVSLVHNDSDVFTASIDADTGADNVTVYLRANLVKSIDPEDIGVVLDGESVAPEVVKSTAGNRWIGLNIPQPSNRSVTLFAERPVGVTATPARTAVGTGDQVEVEVTVSGADQPLSNVVVRRGGERLVTGDCDQVGCRLSLPVSLEKDSWSQSADKYVPVSLRILAVNRNETVTATTARVTVYKVGDVNRDGTVGVLDAVQVGRSWRATQGETSYSVRADLNGDGIVDVYDAVRIGRHWGESVLSEPSGV